MLSVSLPLLPDEANIVTEPELYTLKCLMDTIDGKILRVVRGELPELDVRGCLVHRALIRQVVGGAPETPLSAFSHENLAPHKVIVDEDFNVQG